VCCMRVAVCYHLLARPSIECPVAVRCSALQCVACGWQCVACVLQCVTICWQDRVLNVLLQCVAVRCIVLQCLACELQCVACVLQCVTIC